MIDEDEIYEFSAVITYEKWYSEDSTWGVFGFSTTDDIPKYTQQTNTYDPFGNNTQADSKLKFSQLAGKMQHLSVGGEYLVKAHYKKDPRYGDQYVPIAVYALIPQTKEAQIIFSEIANL